MNIKKPKHILNVPLCHGEVSVVLSRSAENMLTHSTKLASDIRKLGVGWCQGFIGG